MARKIAKKAGSNRKPARRVAAAKSPQLDFKLLGSSDAAVSKATGRGWAEWLNLLDGFDVKKHGHAAASEHLHDKHKCPPWWSQMVVVGYERIRGLRAVHEKADGFSASASRTIAASADQILDAFENTRLAAKWLPKGVKVHLVSRPKSARMTWTDGTRVLSASLLEKKDKSGTTKTSVAIQHDKLANAAARAKMKAIWGERVEALRELIEG